MDIEKTWTPEPVRAWRYWTDIACGLLVGARSPWETATYEAGDHTFSEVTQLAGTVNLSAFYAQAMLMGGEEPKRITHQSPDWGCLCGLNATKELNLHTARSVIGAQLGCDLPSDRFSLLFNPYGQDLKVKMWAFAPVLLSGRVHEYELGYRAERATITEQITVVMDTQYPVVFDEEVRVAMEKRYGVPVVVRSYNEVMAEWAILAEKENEDGHGTTDQGDHGGAGAGGGARGGAARGASLTPTGTITATGNYLTGWSPGWTTVSRSYHSGWASAYSKALASAIDPPTRWERLKSWRRRNSFMIYWWTAFLTTVGSMVAIWIDAYHPNG